eukprot:UC1_evm1s577
MTVLSFVCYIFIILAYTNEYSVSQVAYASKILTPCGAERNLVLESEAGHAMLRGVWTLGTDGKGYHGHSFWQANTGYNRNGDDERNTLAGTAAAGTPLPPEQKRRPLDAKFQAQLLHA